MIRSDSVPCLNFKSFKTTSIASRYDMLATEDELNRKNDGTNLISCPPTTWLATYVMGYKWSEQEITSTLAILREHGHVNEKGWKGLWGGSDIAFRVYNDLFTVMRSAAHKVKTTPGTQTEIFINSGRERIACEFETKDEATFIYQNEYCIWRRAKCTLAAEPERRFVIGLTIEGSRTRFWSFNRGHIGVSEFFDCNKEPDLLVKFYIYSLCASDQQLGFDPTIQRLDSINGDPGSFRFFVEGKYYQTVPDSPALYDYAQHILNRGCRVWKVKAWKDGELVGPEMVLKDVWVKEDACAELTIQKDIIRRLAKLDERNARVGNTTEYQTKVKHYLIEILHEWCVTFSDGEVDVTPAIPCDAQKASWISIPDVQQEEKWYRTWISTEDDLHKRRKHVRTVLSDVCSRPESITDLIKLLTCMSHIVEGLWYFRLAGYVHRDISTGNCLWNDATQQGKISDLEYAIPYEKTFKDDPTRGTPQFMAVEYAACMYEFTPKRKVSFGIKDPTKCRMDFYFNYYHDLESVYWMCLYYLLSHVPHIRPNVSTAEAISLLQSLRSTWREYFIETGSFFRLRNLIDPDLDEWHYQFLDFKWYSPLLPAKIILLTNLEPLTEAYAALEKENYKSVNGTMRWEDRHFHKAPYQSLLDVFTEITSILKKEHIDTRVVHCDDMMRSLLEEQKKANLKRKRSVSSSSSK